MSNQIGQIWQPNNSSGIIKSVLIDCYKNKVVFLSNKNLIFFSTCEIRVHCQKYENSFWSFDTFSVKITNFYCIVCFIWNKYVFTWKKHSEVFNFVKNECTYLSTLPVSLQKIEINTTSWSNSSISGAKPFFLLTHMYKEKQWSYKNSNTLWIYICKVKKQ